jgi:hypothetical protein
MGYSYSAPLTMHIVPVRAWMDGWMDAASESSIDDDDLSIHPSLVQLYIFGKVATIK